MKVKLLKTLFLASLVLMAGCQVQGNAFRGHLTDSPTRVEKALNSTVAIVESSPSGLIGPICTAFFIGPRTLATANHCVVPRTTRFIEVAPGVRVEVPVDNPEPELGREILIVDYKSHNDFINNNEANPSIVVHRTTVIRFNKARDVAVIRLVDGEPSSQNYFRVANYLPRVGSRLYEIGMPMRQFWLFTQGIVSSLRRFPDGHTEIIHQAHVAPGASGGPIFNDNGEIVGITVAYIRNTNYIGYSSTSLDLLHLLEQPIATADNNCSNSSCLLP